METGVTKLAPPSPSRATRHGVLGAVLAEIVRYLHGNKQGGLRLFKNDDRRLEKGKGEAWKHLCKPIMESGGMGLEAGKALSRGSTVCESGPVQYYAIRV